jgi:type IV secretion system protein VirB10
MTKNTENQDNQDTENKEEIVESEIQSELAKIASNPIKSFSILGAAILVLGYIVYSIIFPPEKKVDEQPIVPSNLVKPTNQDMPEVPQIPKMPEIPTLVAPEVKVPAPVPEAEKAAKPEAPKPVVSSEREVKLPSENNKDMQDKIDKKRKASIMLLNNPQVKKAITPEKAQQMEAFKPRSELKYLLTKGKIIEVVLETAINTDHPSEIRGVISRDVFAEDGETRLIPKGSKIFGSFKNQVDGIYGIIAISWTRIDLATGYSLMLSASSVDNLGRAGVQGRLDHKYREQVTQNVLSSAINVGLAQILDKVIVPGTNTVGAANNQLLQTQLNQLVTDTSTTLGPKVANNTATPGEINTTCTNGLSYFKDPTMQAYKDLQTVCTSLPTTPADPAPTPQYTSAYNKLIAGIQTASTAVATANVTQSDSTLTPTQTAFQDSVKSLTGLAKDMLNAQKYTPNVTVNQGELIRVYVNQDYVFPKNAVSSHNIIQ